MNPEQRELLLTAISLYLNHQWTMVMPSPERNATIRVLQMLKGKLLPLLESPFLASYPLPLSVEEQIVVRDMLNELLQHAGALAEFSSPERQANLLALKTYIEWNRSV